MLSRYLHFAQFTLLPKRFSPREATDSVNVPTLDRYRCRYLRPRKIPLVKEEINCQFESIPQILPVYGRTTLSNFRQHIKPNLLADCDFLKSIYCSNVSL